MLWALGFFSEQFLEHHHVKGLVGHQLLKLAVLVLKQAQTPSVVNLHTTKLLLPFVVGALADAVATAKLLDSSSGLCFLQNRDDLFFTVSLSLHGFGSVCLFRGRSSTQLWPNQRGKLTALGEIAGCYTFWMWLRESKSPLWLLPGLLSLALFAFALIRIDSAIAGRAFAAYGGIYILCSLIWMATV